MKKFLQDKPIHCFLIGMYIISFIYVRNIDQITFAMMYRSIIVCLLSSLLLYGGFYLLYRSQKKAGIITTLLVTGFFIYGFIYDQLEALFYQGKWPFAHIHRFLILIYLLCYLFLIIKFFRSKRPYYTSNYLLNIFVLALLFLNAFGGVFRVSKSKAAVSLTKNVFLTESHQSHTPPGNAMSLPDVYYIVLDGYAGEQTLKKFYSENSTFLYDSLRKKGFYIADSSRSNYSFTAPSLASSMNINYLSSKKEENNTYELIRQNLVSYIFKQNNYRVINIKTGFALSGTLAFADKTIKIAGFNEFERRLLELTVLRLDDVLGFSRFKQLRSQLDELAQFTKESGPKFSFIHIVAPHPPYVVDSTGERKLRNTLSDMAWEPRSDYEGQLKYISKRIMSFIDQVLDQSKTPPIIVLQSDHGPWISDRNPQNVFEARTRILNAYYVPESYKSHLYKQISPVNSFRVISSQLFHLNYPLLPDQPVPFSEIAKDVTFKQYAHLSK